MIKQLGVLGDVLRKRSNLHLHLDLSLLSVSRLEKGLFYNCVALQSVVLPNNCWVVGSRCFAGCTKLTHIHLPKNLEFVAGTSFLGCTHLTFSLDKMNTSFSTDSSGKLLLSYDGKILHAYPSATGQVKLPSGIQRIGNNLFRHCKDITDIELPEGLEVIDEFAFMECRALRSLQLPKSLQKLGWGAFVACSGLQEVILLGKLENLSFGHCEDEDVLERSCQYPSLKQTNGWNDVIGDGVNPKIRVLTEDFSV